MHRSVGAIIRNADEDILMIDRKIMPFGWACPAGHIDADETPEDAMVREVYEETGLRVTKYNLVHHEYVAWNTCSQGMKGHDWYVFDVEEFTGNIKIAEEEVKNYKWASKKDLDNIEYEKVWQLWYEKGLL